MSLLRASVAAVSVLAWGNIAASACGFENPSSADTERGLLNWAFPNALYVQSAVWKAQSDGLIGRPQSGAAHALLGYQRALKHLQALGAKLAVAARGRNEPGLSLVMVGPMLWVRLEMREGQVSIQPHMQSAAPGDVVVVTDEAVVAAIANGMITPAAAFAQGLMRLYGSPEARAMAEVWLQDVSAVATHADAQPR